MTKILLSSVISVPEYTPLSSQMDNILSTDLITLGSPSRLEKKQEDYAVNQEIYMVLL